MFKNNSGKTITRIVIILLRLIFREEENFLKILKLYSWKKKIATVKVLDIFQMSFEKWNEIFEIKERKFIAYKRLGFSVSVII